MIEIQCEQRSEMWHEARLGRLTASSFAKMMSGTSTIGYKDLVSQIAAEIATGEVEDSYQSDDMLRGIELEPEAAEVYGETIESGFIIPDEDDPLHKWIGCSIDRWIRPGILEIKCPKLKTHWQYIQKGVLPSIYKAQVQGQLFITGAPYCDFMSYYPGVKNFIIRVFPDPEMHAQLKQRIIETIPLIESEIENYRQYDYE